MRTRTLVGCAAAVGPLFTAVFTVAGRRRPGGYDPRRDAVSTLVRHEDGWVQTASFFANGTLACVGAMGLRRTLGPGPGSAVVPICVGAAGAGMLSAGCFATDTPEETARDGLSRTGALHVASAVPVFVGLPLACLVGARRLASEGRPVAATLSVTIGAVSITAATLAGRGFAGPGPLSERAGTFQRIAVVSALGWVSWFAASRRG